ncbi:hypothetical protein F5Y11DRAFT_164411 [Daldinia sp. FL1419]|nr:hypothetical protein F5Y11DRAFT_164411 [Daldinia sp. FL1419]
MVFVFESLPFELLLMILAAVKSFAGVSNLLSCLKVCKKWHDAGISELYRHVVLNCRNTRRFAETFNPRKAAQVLSLTVLVTKPPRPTGYNIDREFELVPDILTNLDNLSSFSFCTPPPVHLDIRPILRILIRLIDALPQSCVNLEVDTIAYHRYYPRSRPLDHICDKLRCVLPRMRHVSLKLPVICPAVLSTSSTNQDDLPTPLKLPNLQNLFVQCRYGSRNVRLCELGRSTSWAPMTSIMQKLADDPEACPPPASLFALGGTQFTQPRIHTFILAELHSRISWAFPVIVLDSGGWLIRMGGGKGVVSSWGEHITKVIEVTWKTLKSGARIPSVIADREYEPTQGLLPPLFEESRWRAMNPSKTCRAWEKEFVTGTIMIDAELRQDPATYLDLRQVTEKTLETT